MNIIIIPDITIPTIVPVLSMFTIWNGNMTAVIPIVEYMILIFDGLCGK